jgi:hypothetical protein
MTKTRAPVSPLTAAETFRPAVAGRRICYRFSQRLGVLARVVAPRPDRRAPTNALVRAGRYRLVGTSVSGTLVPPLERL